VFLEEGSGMAYTFTKLNDIKPAMVAEATRDARAAAEQFAKHHLKSLINDDKIAAARENVLADLNRAIEALRKECSGRVEGWVGKMEKTGWNTRLVLSEDAKRAISDEVLRLVDTSIYAMIKELATERLKYWEDKILVSMHGAANDLNKDLEKHVAQLRKEAIDAAVAARLKLAAGAEA
jgi:hypothetical protein